jgi:hypothetical protein
MIPGLFDATFKGEPSASPPNSAIIDDRPTERYCLPEATSYPDGSIPFSL